MGAVRGQGRRVIDDNGDEWLGVNAAATAAGVRPNTIRVWITRGIVRSVKDHNTRYVRLIDVQTAERAWRQRTRRPPH
jgi:hypothetical protein